MISNIPVADYSAIKFKYVLVVIIVKINIAFVLLIGTIQLLHLNGMLDYPLKTIYVSSFLLFNILERYGYTCQTSGFKCSGNGFPLQMQYISVAEHSSSKAFSSSVILK